MNAFRVTVFVCLAIAGFGAMGNHYERTKTALHVSVEEPVILGHRIAPNGQEIIVYAK